MSYPPLVLIPLTSLVCYAGLLALLARKSPERSRAREFAMFLTVMGATSAASFAWRLMEGSAADEPLLRLVELGGMSVGAVFLWMLQSIYPTRWSYRLRVAAAVSLTAIGGATLSGGVNVVAMGDGSVEPHPAQFALFVAGMLAWPISYIAAFVNVVLLHRSQRDAFERNRLKYLGISAVLVAFGSFTNVIPLLQALPVDQGANVLAATLIGFSILRYRLFDVNVVIKLGAIRALTALVVAPLYYVGVSVAIEPLRTELLTTSGLVIALGVGLLVGMAAPSIRGLIERTADRLFLGGHVEHDHAVFEFSRVSRDVRSVEAFSQETADLLQRATASGMVAVLLVREDELRLSALSGPFARLQPEWTIRRENTVLRAVTARHEPTTPLMLAHLLESAAYEPGDVAELGPYRSHILAPIEAHGDLVGYIVVGAKVYDDAFALADLDLLQFVAGQAGVVIQNAQLLERLREQAFSDALTGLPNHRKLYEELGTLLARAEATNEPLAVAMVDIDNFKMLNDVHGHGAGDDALRRIAAAMLDAAGPGRVVGRYGGDEFLVLLPRTTAPEARDAMAAIERRVRRVELLGDGPGPRAERDRLPARISWGVAAFPEGGDNPRALVAAADSQLLQRRFEMRRTGTVHVNRPTVARLLEHDPEKLRYARALLDIIDAKDPYTSEHSQQVASLALLVAQELGLSDRDRLALWLGGLLHDIGKIGTPVEVLRKPGALSYAEREAMRQHASLGEAMARGMFDMPEVIDIIGCHHERFDGAGYPRGLAGNEIPRLVRVVSVVDAFSAMVHDRPYRKGLTWEEAVVELRAHAGRQFDPAIVEAFVAAMGRDRKSVSNEDERREHAA